MTSVGDADPIEPHSSSDPAFEQYELVCSILVQEQVRLFGQMQELVRSGETDLRPTRAFQSWEVLKGVVETLRELQALYHSPGDSR